MHWSYFEYEGNDFRRVEQNSFKLHFKSKLPQVLTIPCHWKQNGNWKKNRKASRNVAMMKPGDVTSAVL